MDIWVVSIFWLLWIMLVWTSVHKYLFETLSSILLVMSLGEEKSRTFKPLFLPVTLSRDILFFWVIQSKCRSYVHALKNEQLHSSPLMCYSPLSFPLASSSSPEFDASRCSYKGFWYLTLSTCLWWSLFKLGLSPGTTLGTDKVSWEKLSWGHNIKGNLIEMESVIKRIILESSTLIQLWMNYYLLVTVKIQQRMRQELTF